MTARPLLAPPRLVRALLAGRLSRLTLPAGHPAAAAAPGEALYIRELVHFVGAAGAPPTAATYAADGAAVDLAAWPAGAVLPANFAAARHPGAWASRFWLTVTAHQLQPLLAITDADAIAEGVPPAPPRPPGLPAWVRPPTPRGDRLAAWDAEHPDTPAASNPLVAVLTVTVTGP